MSIGFRVLVSRHPAIQTTGLLTLAPAGPSPAEHASLRWTHTRTCRFPASGSSRESFARVGAKAVDDPRRWKRMALEDRVEAGPGEPTSATMPSRQPFLPQHHNLASEPWYTSRVARYAVVGIVASHHLGQMGMLSSRPTTVDMRAIQRRAPANSRIVDRRRQCRPINPAKIVVEYRGFATIALRTFPRVSPTPAPPAASAALNAPHERPTPIGRG